MIAFPVTKLPPHPPGNTNTLWASSGYNERGSDRGRDTEWENTEVRQKN